MSHVTLINLFKGVPLKDTKWFIESSWSGMFDELENYDGFIDALLHQSLDDGATFRLVNISKWESTQKFGAALSSEPVQKKLQKDMAGAPFVAYPSLYVTQNRSFQLPQSPDEAVTLINPFEVPAGEDDAFIKGWTMARDYLIQSEGLIDSALHKSLRPNAKYRFVNLALWKTVEHFQRATSDAEFRQLLQHMPYAHHPALYKVVARY